MAKQYTVHNITQTEQLAQHYGNDHLTHALENEHIITLPKLGFTIHDTEKTFFDPQILAGNRKNISYDIARQRLAGDNLQESERSHLMAMLHRYALFASNLVQNAFSHYASHIEVGRTSFRPAAIDERVQLSKNKDDRLLHIDAFPSSPTQGKRILRVFTNVDLQSRAREWRIGDESFEALVRRFVAPLEPAPELLLNCLDWLGITKSKRSLYDDLMLKFHKALKFNERFQQTDEQQYLHFWPGTTWVVMTDQVTHAAMKGQFCLEQTFYLPAEKQLNPERSPLKILESLKQRCLA